MLARKDPEEVTMTSNQNRFAMQSWFRSSSKNGMFLAHSVERPLANVPILCGPGLEERTSSGFDGPFKNPTICQPNLS